MNHSKRLFLATIAIAATIAAAPSASAFEAHRVAVSYADLDLSHPHDMAVLRERIAQAAAKACGGNPAFTTRYPSASIYERKSFEACRKAAIENATASLANATAKIEAANP